MEHMGMGFIDLIGHLGHNCNPQRVQPQSAQELEGVARCRHPHMEPSRDAEGTTGREGGQCAQ